MSSYRPNPLDSFVNYTYGLTLSAAKPGSFSASGSVMVASGGRRENRAAEFFEDFYFDNFQMTTVIGMNSNTRGSNVVTIKFSILEPYGITFLNRLLELATNLGAENWTEMSFIIKVDFFGNNESGMPAGPLSGQTKVIPVKIISCEVKASSKGSEYRFTATPYHHMSFQQTSGSTPSFAEVTAETVEQFFNGTGETDASYSKALNDHQKKLVKDKYIDIADQYSFEIDSKIGKAKIVDSKKNAYNHIPMASDNNSSAKTSDGIKAAQSREDQAPAKLDQKKQAVGINAGTSIIDIIGQTIRNSNYVVDQVGKGGGGPVAWYKVVSDVQILGFDSKRNTYAKKYIYKILPTEIHNTKYPDAPLSQPPTAQKIYQYIYTGKNQQILDFSLDFNTMFYTAITAHRYKLKTTDTSQEPPSEDVEKDKGITNNTKRDIQPAQMKMVPAQADVSSTHQGSNDIANVSANDLYKSMMSTSRGDMINVRLKITGDPEFIKQDDIAYKSTGTVGQVDDYGSITTDGGEIYVDLFFRSPRDINQSTGMYDFSNWQDAAFNGRYRVITVDNTFERGQFTQILNLVRVFNQDNNPSAPDSDTPSGAASVSAAEAASETQRLINRSRSIPTTNASSAATKETSPRPATVAGDAAQNTVTNFADRFSGITPEDVTSWNIPG